VYAEQLKSAFTQHSMQGLTLVLLNCIHTCVSLPALPIPYKLVHTSFTQGPHGD